MQYEELTPEQMQALINVISIRQHNEREEKLMFLGSGHTPKFKNYNKEFGGKTAEDEEKQLEQLKKLTSQNLDKLKEFDKGFDNRK